MVLKPRKTCMRRGHTITIFFFYKISYVQNWKWKKASLNSNKNLILRSGITFFALIAAHIPDAQIEMGKRSYIFFSFFSLAFFFEVYPKHTKI